MALRPQEMRRKVVCIVEELTKFGRSLRKFRKAAIATNGDEEDHQFPYKRIDDDRFEHYMRDFARRGQLSCESLLSLHGEAVSRAQSVAQQYHYQLDPERIEDLLSIFAHFADDFRRSMNDRENMAVTERRTQRLRRRRADIGLKLKRFLERRPSREGLEAKRIVIDVEVMEQRLKEKEFHKNVLSKLVYEHAVLQDHDQKLAVAADHNVDHQHHHHHALNSNENEDQSMSFRRIKYLKGLAKSNDLPNQLSNNVEAMQKQRRRRRSLSATDIQIGAKMAMTLAEDKEMK